MFPIFYIAVLSFLVAVDSTSGERKVSRTIAVGTEVKTPANFDCPEEFGYYPHPNDCTQYYVCVFGGALLESCTGGLMYSHELQTCDWPRNVGCDGSETSSNSQSSSASSSSQSAGRSREREESRTRYTPPPPPPPAQPSAVVTSRGQSRQLHHNQKEIIKQQQQQQLYAEAEESLPPAEEIESDRQQRVYRGQPSTVGQVERDRDGLRHTNAIQSYGGRGEKIGVISFGTQQQQQQQQQQPIQHYSGMTDELLTNDLTLKRRRKRQTRSRPNEPSASWHGLRNTYIRHTAPVTFLPSPVVQNLPNFNPNYEQLDIITTRPTNSNEFQPFIPNYKNAYATLSTPQRTPSIDNYQHFNSNLNNNKFKNVQLTTPNPVTYQDNYSYFNLGTTPSNFKTNTKPPKQSTIDYSNNDRLVLQSAYSNNIQSPQKILVNNTDKPMEYKSITEAITSGYSKNYQSSTPKSIYNNKSNGEDDEEKDEYKINEDYFGPPPSYFKNENRYENIENPFARPDFDFEKFLNNLRGTTQKPKLEIVPTNLLKSETVTIKPKNVPLITVSNKHKLPVSEYYYDEYEDDIVPTKKTYSSQSKANVNTKNNNIVVTTNKKPLDDEYEYYYDDDYTEQKKGSLPNNKNNYYYYDYADDPLKRQKTNNHNNTIRIGNVKYSAKYQEEIPNTKTTPNQIISPKHSVPTTIRPIVYTTKRYIINTNNTITSTTPKIVYTVRQKSKSTTRPSRNKTARGKIRQRLTSTTTQRPDIRREKIKILSEGTSSASPAAQQASISTVTSAPRNIYNTTQYNNHYDPYYALYDDDVELYRDVEYSHNNNNNYNNNAQQTHQHPAYRGTPAPAVVQQSTASHEEAPKRGNTVYLQNNYSPQDIYQQSTVSDYNEDNSYASQADDQNYRQSNRQPSRGDRNEINDLEEGTIKRTTTRKPTTTSLLRTTFRTNTAPPLKKLTSQISREPVTAKENQTQAQSIINTIQESPGHVHVAPKYLPATQNSQNDSLTNRLDISTTTTTVTPLLPVTYRPNLLDTLSESTLHETIRAAIIKKPAPFSLPLHITERTKPAASYHYITKIPKTTLQIFNTSSSKERDYINNANISKVANVINTTQSVLLTFSNQRNKPIVPTTYSPPKFFLKSILPKSILSSTLLDSPIFNFRSANRSSLPPKQLESRYINKPETVLSTPHKTLKSVRKLINPITVNHALSTTTDINYDSIEKFVENEQYASAETPLFRTKVESKLFFNEGDNFAPTTIRYKPTVTTSTTSTTTTTTTTTTIAPPIISAEVHNIRNLDDYIQDSLELNNLRQFDDLNSENETITNEKRFRTTIEIPPAHELIDTAIKQKLEPDQPPSYKLKPYPKPNVPIPTKTDSPQNTSFPVRISRVNAAIKSLIANGGTRRQNSKCNENQTPNTKCNNDPHQRNPARGRGSAHYSGSSGNIVNNEVTVNTNRGTPAPRSRPTLKPSTSIVSKASEFIDIYRYPPRRPDPIYPQPQPDKTAAKCRKDVCLLPDCSCGGKEIPGDVPAEQVPQLVLLTYDDSVNDLNKGLYSDLFEKGRTNPNGCPIAATFYVSHEWTDYSQVQNLYSDGHEIASHTVSHSFGEQFSQKKWTREVAGQREILSAYGGVHLEDVRGMRAPFLSVGGNKMFKMLYDSNFTYDSSMPIYENKPPSWPYTLDYKLFHDCMIPPCPTRSYPGVWEVPMVMWQDLNGGRCSMGDACSNPPDAEGVFKMLMKNFQRHYTTNRAPFGLFYHAAWFTQPHHKEGFINFIDTILAMKDVWFVTNWQAIQWVRDPTPTSRLGSFQPFQCDFSDRPKRCNNPKVCNLWHKSGVRYMRTCQPCPDIYPWTGNTGIRSSRIDNDIED